MSIRTFSPTTLLAVGDAKGVILAKRHIPVQSRVLLAYPAALSQGMTGWPHFQCLQAPHINLTSVSWYSPTSSVSFRSGCLTSLYSHEGVLRARRHPQGLFVPSRDLFDLRK
jgi:hypothetical protein